MKRIASLFAFALFFIAVPAWGASGLPAETITSMAFIANYDEDGNFLGWGSGFFVDEGIVVTNRHVIEGGDWYRVYATKTSESVELDCYKKITKSDVKLNLEDDVAYMRVYLPCEHGTINFGHDPENGDPVSVMGYPYKGTISGSLALTVTTGVVTGDTPEGWLRTDAHMDVGNSGGPVISDAAVVGVAVAKGVDSEGAYVTGYFIPSSVILNGLLYANDPRFGYTPRSLASSSRHSSSRSSSTVMSSSSSSQSSSSRSSVSSRRSSSSQRSSVRSVPLEQTSPQFRARTCERVMRWFRNDAKMLGRVNARLQKRFGFVCG